MTTAQVKKTKWENTFTLDNKSEYSWFSNSLSSHLERFVNYLQYTKNSSPKTIENYTLRINRFINFIGDCDADEVKMLHIQDFRTYLIKKWLTPKTVNYHVVGLRSFFKFLLRNDIDTISPDKLDLAKIPPRKVSYLSEQEVQTILRAPAKSCYPILNMITCNWTNFFEKIWNTVERNPIFCDMKMI